MHSRITAADMAMIGAAVTTIVELGLVVLLGRGFVVARLLCGAMG